MKSKIQKPKKKWSKIKTNRTLWICLIKKMKIPEVFEFSIFLYTQNRKLGNRRKFYFTSIFGSIWNPRFKNQKQRPNTKKTTNLRYYLVRKIRNIQGFQVFNVCLYQKIKKCKSRKVFFTSILKQKIQKNDLGQRRL